MRTVEISHFWQDLLDILPQRIGVLGHVRGDGDSTGSQIALTRALKLAGKDATLFFEKALSESLQTFIEDTQSQVIEDFATHEVDGWVIVDCADLKRLPVSSNKPLLGLVDHHRSTRPYAELNCIESNYAATAEILTALFQANNLPIDYTTANALYLGILTDTGQFTYRNTTAQTLEKAAYLVSQGASPSLVSERIFNQVTLPQLHLKQLFLKNLHLEIEGKVCIGTLTTQDFELAKTTPLDAVDFVDRTRSIKGVLAGAYIEEYQGRIKVSLRSNTDSLKLDELASHFGGGGHAAAAGFTVNDKDLAIVYKELLDLFRKLMR